MDIDEILESGLKLDFNKPPFRQKQKPESMQEERVPQAMPFVDQFPSTIDYISIDDSATMALKNVGFLGIR